VPSQHASVPKSLSEYLELVLKLIAYTSHPAAPKTAFDPECGQDPDGAVVTMQVLWSIGSREPEHFLTAVRGAGVEDVDRFICRLRFAYAMASGWIKRMGKQVPVARDDFEATTYAMEPLVRERAGVFRLAAFNLAVLCLDRAGIVLPHHGDVALLYLIVDPHATCEERADALRRLCRPDPGSQPGAPAELEPGPEPSGTGDVEPVPDVKRDL
jgi:hypothetical protein